VLAPRTLKILAVLVAVFVLLALPAYVGPRVLEAMSARVAMVPLLSVYLFHAAGVPGLLEHGGHCGWGWCNPTAFGFAFTAAFWLLAFWLAAWGLARLTARRAD
jgi:hypothetical protein